MPNAAISAKIVMEILFLLREKFTEMLDAAFIESIVWFNLLTSVFSKRIESSLVLSISILCPTSPIKDVKVDNFLYCSEIGVIPEISFSKGFLEVELFSIIKRLD